MVPSHDSTVASATAILVLGMHRSGTSALAAAVEKMGASLGGELVPAGVDNPGGYFENAAAVTTHELLLAELGRGWEDLRELPQGWLDSAAGREAGKSVADLLAREFADKPLWALKDPRLCRLLPLWRSPLANAAVQAKCLFVLRDPDEVGASLSKRDGIGMDHAYLLWVRYFLDAERDSRGMHRSMLTYEDLLADPAGSMARAGRELQVDWPNLPEEGALAALLDPQMRHHRRFPDAPVEGPRLLALELYRAAVDGHWPDGEAQRKALEEWTQRLAPWLDGPSNALARARRDGMRALQRCQGVESALEETKSLSLVRLQEVHMLDARLEATDGALDEATAESLARLEEIHALAKRIESTDVALAEAKALSLARLEELRALTKRIESTDMALGEAKALSLARLAELKALSKRIESTDVALGEAKALSLARLAELQALAKRIESTDVALGEAKALSLARLEELHVLAKRLVETDAALDEAKALSLSRLDEIRILQARLESTDAALDEASRLSLSRMHDLQVLDTRLASTAEALSTTEALSLLRLGELQALDARLQRTDQALQAVETQSIERLHEIEALSRRLEVTDAAFTEAQRLSLERLQQVQVLDSRLVATDAALANAQSLAHAHALGLHATQSRLADVQTRADSAEQTAAGLHAELQAIRTSMTWRLLRPMRWLERRLGNDRRAAR